VIASADIAAGTVEIPALPSRLLQIVSGSRDKTIRLWNTLGECKFTIGEPEGHTGEGFCRALGAERFCRALGALRATPVMGF